MSGLSSELMTSSLLLNNAEILLSNAKTEQENKFICTLQVIKRNGKLVHYDPSKIRVAITKAFLAVEGGQAALSTRIHERVSQLTQQVTNIIQQRHPNGGTLPIEAIQDQVELALMRVEAHQVARAYVLYREERRKMRAETHAQSDIQLQITLADGSQRPLDLTQLSLLITETCKDLSEVKHELILQETLRNLYDGMPILEIDKALIISARTLVEQDPNYTYATARFLLRALYTEALDFLKLPTAIYTNSHVDVYRHYFRHYIKRGIALELLDPQLQNFDLEKLSQALLPERDQQFTYLSLQTLYDRYFLHAEDIRFELPQAFFMRIAMGLAQQESNKEERAIEFYQLLSSFDYMASTPTLFNAGTLRPQLSSCFLTTVSDEIGRAHV